MKLYIWTDRFSYLAVAHTNNVEAARKLMLETSDLGESGDGSCPERDRARKTILEETPAIYFGEVAEFSLSDSAQLREQEEHSETLQQQMAAKDRRIAELEAEIAELAAVVQVNVPRARMSAMTQRSLSVLDTIKIRAKREALEEAAQYFAAVDSWSGWAVFSELRRMAREVKP